MFQFLFVVTPRNGNNRKRQQKSFSFFSLLRIPPNWWKSLKICFSFFSLLRLSIYRCSQSHQVLVSFRCYIFISGYHYMALVFQFLFVVTVLIFFSSRQYTGFSFFSLLLVAHSNKNSFHVCFSFFSLLHDIAVEYRK